MVKKKHQTIFFLEEIPQAALPAGQTFPTWGCSNVCQVPLCFISRARVEQMLERFQLIEKQKKKKKTQKIKNMARC